MAGDRYFCKPERGLNWHKPFFTSPTDILRYLWYKHTGFLQIIEPRTIKTQSEEQSSPWPICFIQWRYKSVANEKAALKLKYTRKDCLMVATWLNNLNTDTAKICEMMHPKRGMWVRFIRALRLAEYSKKNRVR